MDSNSVLNLLRKEITGDVIAPSDEGYQEGNDIFYKEYTQRKPIARVEVADNSDVSKIIRFAGDTGVGLAVRAGGHSALGHSTSEGGLVLDLSALRDIEVDVEGRSAWAGGGVRAGDYTARVAEHGLVTGFGDTGSVGVAGLTLGGGIGFLHRKLGLTIDSLLGAEIVTADGEVHRINAGERPDLFWAIRGGGGNFGVVTKLHYRLHPIDTVVGGMVVLPATPQVIADFVAAATDASDDLSAIAGIMVAPPMPFLPEEAHGQMVVVALMVHSGDIAAGEVEVDRFRRLATPMHDDLKVMRYAEMFPPDEAGPPQPEAMSLRSVFSDEFTLPEAEVVVDALRSSNAAMSVIQIRVLGGAVSRIPNDATAFAHRSRAMVLNLAAAYESPSRRPEYEVWVEGLASKLRKGPAGSYVNFLGDDSEGAVREIYPGETWDRLVEVKSKYDENNLFSSNHNIPPPA
jgi:FAD/FMN-containing dehydrogenase